MSVLGGLKKRLEFDQDFYKLLPKKASINEIDKDSRWFKMKDASEMLKYKKVQT